MTLADLAEIARDHHRTGCYTGYHLRVGANVWAAMLAYTTATTETPTQDGQIPVVVDDEYGTDVWRLAQISYTTGPDMVPVRHDVTARSGTLATEPTTAPTSAEETP